MTKSNNVLICLIEGFSLFLYNVYYHREEGEVDKHRHREEEGDRGRDPERE